MSAYVGVDLSTHAVDLVKLDEESDRAEWVRVPLVGENAIDRARSFDTKRHEPFDWDRPTPGRRWTWSNWWDDVILCALEDPAGRGDTRKIARVQGVVIATIPARVQVWTFAPAEWRKACGLPGNCSKETVASWADSRMQQADGSAMNDSAYRFTRADLAPCLDAYDAYAVAYAARSINESAASVAEGNQTQEEAA